jgi:hypothetical protein
VAPAARSFRGLARQIRRRTTFDEASGTLRATDDLLRVAGVVHADEVSVSFSPGPTVRAKVGQSRRIEYRCGVAVGAIDLAYRTVETWDGDRLHYDRLVLATGARPLVPPIEGFGVPGCFVLRTIDDAVQIQQHIRRCRCRMAVSWVPGLSGWGLRGGAERPRRPLRQVSRRPRPGARRRPRSAARPRAAARS